jgi:hypothetical protein
MTGCWVGLSYDGRALVTGRSALAKTQKGRTASCTSSNSV